MPVPGIDFQAVKQLEGQARDGGVLGFLAFFSGGGLTRTLYVTPYVGFSKLDVVGVVVQAPKKDPRDTVLPDKPKPKPTPTVTVTVTPGAEVPEGDGTQQQGDAQDQPLAGGLRPRTDDQYQYEQDQ